MLRIKEKEISTYRLILRIRNRNRYVDKEIDRELIRGRYIIIDQ